ncbi:MAG: DNA-directed RNA polymerase subunit alpha C-terminal domain-containing protein [Verrucomicrobiota bacterium]
MSNPIDAWPVVTAGLTFRTAMCLRRAGIITVGELRQLPDEKLLEIPGLADGLLQNVHWFCERTRQLKATPPDVRTWLDEFLTPLQRTVIERRYGLTDPLFRPGMKPAPLRDVGWELRPALRTERVCQIEAAALLRLRSRLARELAKPLRAPVASATRGAKVLAEYEPWGVNFLLENRIFLA